MLASTQRSRVGTTTPGGRATNASQERKWRPVRLNPVGGDLKNANTDITCSFFKASSRGIRSAANNTRTEVTDMRCS